jgi:predicted naringenin-chalcone synthase
MTHVAHINAIGIASPPHDIHEKFIDYVSACLPEPREEAVFRRMAGRSGIARRPSVLSPGVHPDWFDREGQYQRGDLPGTSARMARYAVEAPRLAIAAVEDLLSRVGADSLSCLTHLITVTCTGFLAPGIDVILMDHFGLPADVERTIVGFMGCNAAFNGLKLARHIVRSNPAARVLVVNVEVCTIHIQDPKSVDEALMLFLFADAAAATLVTADARGFALDRFSQAILPNSRSEMTWKIGDHGFEMYLSGNVPKFIAQHLPAHMTRFLGDMPTSEIALWAVHPGGRSILDAVGGSLGLPGQALQTSRTVLNDHGNLSSVTVLFVLNRMMAEGGHHRRGVALGFGPGLAVESLVFAEAG